MLGEIKICPWVNAIFFCLSCVCLCLCVAIKTMFSTPFAPISADQDHQGLQRTPYMASTRWCLWLRTPRRARAMSCANVVLSDSVATPCALSLRSGPSTHDINRGLIDWAWFWCKPLFFGRVNDEKRSPPTPLRSNSSRCLLCLLQFDQNTHGFAANTRSRDDTADVPTCTWNYRCRD